MSPTSGHGTQDQREGPDCLVGGLSSDLDINAQVTGSILKLESSWETQKHGVPGSGPETLWGLGQKGNKSPHSCQLDPSARAGHFCLWKGFHNASCVRTAESGWGWVGGCGLTHGYVPEAREVRRTRAEELPSTPLGRRECLTCRPHDRRVVTSRDGGGESQRCQGRSPGLDHNSGHQHPQGQSVSFV